MLKSVDKNKKACLIHPILQSLYCRVYFHWHGLRLPPPWPPWFLRAEQCKPLRMLGATFPSSDPGKRRSLLALTTRAHLFCTSCFARHVKCTCCVVPWDPGAGGGISLSLSLPFEISQIFPLAWESKHLQISFIHLCSSMFLLLFPAFCAIVSPRPLLMLYSLNTQLHTGSVTRIVPGPRDTETIFLPGRKDRSEYIFEIGECASHIHKNYFT